MRQKIYTALGIIVMVASASLYLGFVYMCNEKAAGANERRQQKIQNGLNDGTWKPTWYGFRETSPLEREEYRRSKLQNDLLQRQLDKQETNK